MIKFKGNEVTLVGKLIQVGDLAPDFTVVDGSMNPIKLSDYKGKKVLLSIFPSIDTGVCQMQTTAFNKRASELSEGIEIITISLDLPFALDRYCSANRIESIKTTSDYQDREFANKYGVLVDQLKLLARGNIIINSDGIVEYVNILEEMTDEPNYDQVMEHLVK